MTKITFTNTLAAFDYARKLEQLGFSSVLTPEMVKESRFCREGNEVYIIVTAG